MMDGILGCVNERADRRMDRSIVTRMEASKQGWKSLTI